MSEEDGLLAAALAAYENKASAGVPPTTGGGPSLTTTAAVAATVGVIGAATSDDSKEDTTGGPSGNKKPPAKPKSIVGKIANHRGAQASIVGLLMSGFFKLQHEINAISAAVEMVPEIEKKMRAIDRKLEEHQDAVDDGLEHMLNAGVHMTANARRLLQMESTEKLKEDIIALESKVLLLEQDRDREKDAEK